MTTSELQHEAQGDGPSVALGEPAGLDLGVCDGHDPFERRRLESHGLSHNECPNQNEAPVSW